MQCKSCFCLTMQVMFLTVCTCTTTHVSSSVSVSLTQIKKVFECSNGILGIPIYCIKMLHIVRSYNWLTSQPSWRWVWYTWWSWSQSTWAFPSTLPAGIWTWTPPRWRLVFLSGWPLLPWRPPPWTASWWILAGTLEPRLPSWRVERHCSFRWSEPSAQREWGNKIIHLAQALFLSIVSFFTW